MDHPCHSGDVIKTLITLIKENKTDVESACWNDVGRQMQNE